jgi:uroporphyrinogen decarboxylase
MAEPLILRVLRGEDTPVAPVWFMRQAGRYLPEYMAIKATHGFWEMARTPELAAEVTLQPVRRLGVDAAILFQDIMTPLPSMGARIEFTPGPEVANPIRTPADVAALRVAPKDEIAPFVATAISQIRAASSTPLFGFGGAPLTLAAYLVEGGGSKEYFELRRFLRCEKAAAHDLMERLTEQSIRYLAMQVEAGAQAIQLFDTWAGLHDLAVYNEFGAPYIARILEAVGKLGVPRIYLALHARHLAPAIAKLPCEAISVDWRTSLDEARTLFPGRVLQGNLDPVALLGPREQLLADVDRVLEAGRGGPHIFNLGHGLDRRTDPDAVAAVVARVRAFARH